MTLVRGGITVKPHVQRFADDISAALGVSNFGTYVGHSPPEGPTQAVDIFTPDNANGYILQDKICEWIIAHQKKYGIRYCIRRHHIWNIERADEGWRDQGVTGDRTADHYDHVHVTFYAKAEVEPDIPVNLLEGELSSMKVRYVWGPDALHITDWVFDAPGRIFAQIGHATLLKACDLNKFPELGRVDDQVHEWFKGVASGWK